MGALLTVGLLTGLASCVIPSDQNTVTPKRFVEAPTISAQAQAKFGDEAGRAYQEIADFVLDQGERSELLDPQRTTFTAQDLTAGLTSHMTPGAAATWEHLVAQALDGDATAEEAVRALRYYKVEAPTLTLPAQGAVDSQTVTGAKVDLLPASTGTVDRLKITFEHTTRISLLNGKSPYPGSIDNQLEFAVIPAGLVVMPTAKPSSTVTAPTSTASPGTTGTPAPTPTLPSADYTRDPAATWLISQFEGDVDLAFDADPSSDATK